MGGKAQSLIRIEKHPNYYKSGSGIIYYKRGALKFSTLTDSITKAKRFVESELAKRSGKTLAQSNREKTGASNPMVSEVFDEMLKSHLPGKGEATKKVYLKNWRMALEPFFGTMRIKDITDRTPHEFRLWYLKFHPRRHAHHTVVHFKLFFKYLKKHKFIRDLPEFESLDELPEIIERQAKREKTGRVLTLDELNRIESGLLDFSLKTQAAVLMGIRTGARKLEILKSKWERFKPKQSVIEVYSEKNGKWREVPLDDQVISLLLELRKHKDGEHIFRQLREDRPMSGQQLDKDWIKLKKRAQIVGRLRFHDLRHTFATRTAELGWPPVVACSVLDMSLRVYQKTYCHTSLESKVQLIKEMARGGLNRAKESSKV